MIQRCTNPGYHAFARYGGRGIEVCERWTSDFQLFLDDMGERPDGMTLDRIDNDLGYSKENCRWANAKTQAANRSAPEAFGSDEWATPGWLAALVGSFDLDPCSNSASHITSAQRYILEDGEDGLALPWRGSVFCNPPYSNVGPWAKRLRDHDGPWCALLKHDSTTRWFATLMEATPTVAPFRKRLKFEGDKSMTANFPSVLVYSAWRPSRELAQHLWLPVYTQQGVSP